MTALSCRLCTGLRWSGNRNVNFLSSLSIRKSPAYRNQQHGVPVRCCSSSKGKVPPRDISEFPVERIRNFSIIAHVDHGKSTLADRLLELTDTIDKEFVNKQVLDNLKVERERGITIKAQTASLFYNYKGEEYLLNLIDTPGHVDFTYEVSRSLTACQGCLLLVDASQGVQAQTVANFYLSFEAEIEMIPVLNKVDMAAADIPKATSQVVGLTDCNEEDVMQISAKTGLGVDTILPAVIEKIPPPTKCSRDDPLRMLVFDSWYVPHRGALCLVALGGGSVAVGESITSLQFDKDYVVDEIGIMHPHRTPTTRLYAGQVGYILCNMKKARDARVGDTLYHTGKPVEPYPGFKPIKPVVFCGIFPIDTDDLPGLRVAIDKLILNDASVDVQRDSSAVLGQGWRMGFLGMLHMEVFNQRLEEEYNANVIATSPSVMYKYIAKKDGKEIVIRAPDQYPLLNHVKEFLEPMIIGSIIFPTEYVGKVMSLCQDRRGTIVDHQSLDETRVLLKYCLPLAEVVVDFYDKLKSVSSGYASFDYEDNGWQQCDLVKVDLAVNGVVVDALSFLAHKSKADPTGRAICQVLQKELPRQWFEVAIQAKLGERVIARETIKALRKDVTAKCYGGDVTRRMKLLSRQKEGKKKMKMVGNVEVPKKVFLSIIKKM